MRAKNEDLTSTILSNILDDHSVKYLYHREQRGEPFHWMMTLCKDSSVITFFQIEILNVAKSNYSATSSKKKHTNALTFRTPAISNTAWPGIVISVR